MKKLILGSVVVAALVFTGCGDDDTTAVDTTAPVITTTDGSVPLALAATDASTVTFSLLGNDKDKFEIVGSSLKAKSGTADNTYALTIVATDAAGNHSSKDITVTVGGGNNGALTFDSVEDNRTTWAVADAACKSAGKRLPTMAELNTTVLPSITFPTNTFTSVLWTSDDDIDSNGAVVADTKIGAWYKNGTSAAPEALPRLLTVHDHDGNASTPDAEFTYFHTCVQ